MVTQPQLHHSESTFDHQERTTVSNQTEVMGAPFNTVIHTIMAWKTEEWRGTDTLPREDVCRHPRDLVRSAVALAVEPAVPVTSRYYLPGVRLASVAAVATRRVGIVWLVVDGVVVVVVVVVGGLVVGGVR